MVVTGFDGKEYEVEPNANLSGTDLAVEGSSLSWQDLSGRDFSHQDLREACLVGSDLRNADLSGANLSGAKLKGANLCCAVCNDETVFPEGLPDPIVKDGAIEVWERPGMRVNLILEATKPYLKEEDVGFFD